MRLVGTHFIVYPLRDDMSFDDQIDEIHGQMEKFAEKKRYIIIWNDLFALNFAFLELYNTLYCMCCHGDTGQKVTRCTRFPREAPTHSERGRGWTYSVK